MRFATRSTFLSLHVLSIPCAALVIASTVNRQLPIGRRGYEALPDPRAAHAAVLPVLFGSSAPVGTLFMAVAEQESYIHGSERIGRAHGRPDGLSAQTAARRDTRAEAQCAEPRIHRQGRGQVPADRRPEWRLALLFTAPLNRYSNVPFAAAFTRRDACLSQAFANA